MLARVRRAAVLAIALVLLAPPARAASERVRVADAFRAFLRALADRDADAGVAVLSQASLVEWQRDRALALDAPRADVEALPPGRRLAVLALRHHEPRFLAQDGTPEALARRAIHAGLVDRDGVAQIELRDVVVQGDRASGQLFAAGLPSGFRAGFVREDDRWRVDLPATLDSAGRVVVQAAKASDSSENAVIAGLLYASSGTRPTLEIWKPLGPRWPAARDAER